MNLNAPKHLDDAAKAFWKKHAKTLHDTGRLTETDLPGFERLCRNWSILQKLDPLTDSKAAILYMSLNKQIAADSAAFGMTPASRKKLRVTLTDGDMIDMAAVRGKVLDLCRAYDVRKVLVDNYNADTMGNEITAATGIVVEKLTMNGKNMSDPIQQFERAVLEGRLHHDGNQWLRYCVQNVRLMFDKWDNATLDKGRSCDKIDAVASSLLAFAIAHQTASAPVVEDAFTTIEVW